MTFDEALQQMADDSIDLLHIDGLHSYEAVRHDFEGWLPKLTDRAVVLFHDTNVRERQFGVWRLWQELCRTYPAFEFLHCNGLGVLAVGREVPRTVAALRALGDGPMATAMRERFALLGERWEAEARLALQQAWVERQQAAMEGELERQEAAMERQQAAAQRQQASVTRLVAEAHARHAEECRAAEREREKLKLKREDALQTLQQANQEIDLLRHERAVILTSTIWRATAPLRRAGRMVPVSVRHRLRRGTAGANAEPITAANETAAPTPVVGGEAMARTGAKAQRIVFVSGEPDTPGHHYRVARYADAASAIGAAPSIMVPGELTERVAELVQADVVVLWRGDVAGNSCRHRRGAVWRRARLVRHRRPDVQSRARHERIDRRHPFATSGTGRRRGSLWTGQGDPGAC